MDDLRLNSGFRHKVTAVMVLDDLTFKLIDLFLERVNQSFLLNVLTSDGADVRLFFLRFVVVVDWLMVTSYQFLVELET